MGSFGWDFPYASRRMPVLARNAVATSQPLAVQAGLRMLEHGGNAVDAAIAAAITLTVVEPTSNGIGSDAFAIVHDGQEMHALNASGRSPAGWSRGHFSKYSRMPEKGWDTVTVPGAVSAWVELSSRFGKLDFRALFEPAVRYARDGFLVSPITASAWAAAVERFREFPEFREAFLVDGRAPSAGETFRCEDLARTLELIADTRGEAFYRGALAKKIVSHAETGGGLMSAEDLSSHKADWVEPLKIDFCGVTLHELPPNGQGIAALIALGILRHMPLADFPVDSADSLHVQIEAMKLALADAHRYVADPAHMDVSPAALLDPAYLEERARAIDMRMARDAGRGIPRSGGTVYLAAADSGGMMASFIQSNYMGFGSGVVVPGTGIALQNRGACFTLERDHPNEVGPRKRPYHTIIPAFVTKDGEPLMAMGVMGGHMQPQGHVQMMVRIFTYGQNLQAAADAPRWQVVSGRDVKVEQGIGQDVLDELVRRGHRIEEAPGSAFGGAQMICRLGEGYVAASDPRKDGQAAGF